MILTANSKFFAISNARKIVVKFLFASAGYSANSQNFSATCNS